MSSSSGIHMGVVRHLASALAPQFGRKTEEDDQNEGPSAQETLALLRECFESGDMARLATSLARPRNFSRVVAAVPGPLDDLSLGDCVTRLEAARRMGSNILESDALAARYGENFVVPAVIFSKPLMSLSPLVVVNNPVDLERLVRKHVKKSQFYQGGLLGNGILSTLDLVQWREQREDLRKAFLPLSSLRAVFPTTARRAEFSVNERLPQLLREAEAEAEVNAGGDKAGSIDLNEFFLYEAMAQLHLSLLGEDEEFMEANNVLLRRAFTSLSHGFGMVSRREFAEAAAFTRRNSAELVLRGQKRAEDDHSAAAAAAAAVATTRSASGGASSPTIVSAPPVTGCPFAHGTHDSAGPLGTTLAHHRPRASDPGRTLVDTMTTFTFAGHDTTGNMMTWCTLELARNPALQRRLQDEVDALARDLAGRLLSYDDLSQLPFLTDLLRETLRLWPSVPNGTFRELETDEFIRGRDGREVCLPKGTQVQLPVWRLHHHRALWGDDALEFNPDREWLPEESWDGQAFAATRTASARFAPFTFSPRDCLGRNFAHMEARAILFYLFSRFTVTLAPATQKIVDERVREGVHPRFPVSNFGTMAPLGGLHVRLHERR